MKAQQGIDKSMKASPIAGMNAGNKHDDLDDEKSSGQSLQSELIGDDGPQVPTEEELRCLPRVADEFP